MWFLPLLNIEQFIKKGLISDITLKNGSWKIHMIFKHLEMHKYAHNGVNNLSTINVDGSETTIFDFVKQNLIIDNDWNTFHFIYNLLHAYDIFYMKKSEHFTNDTKIITNSMALALLIS